MTDTKALRDANPSRYRLATWIGQRFDDGASSVYDDAGLLMPAISAGIEATRRLFALLPAGDVATSREAAFYEAFFRVLERRATPDDPVPDTREATREP